MVNQLAAPSRRRHNLNRSCDMPNMTVDALAAFDRSALRQICTGLDAQGDLIARYAPDDAAIARDMRDAADALRKVLTHCVAADCATGARERDASCELWRERRR